TIFARIGTDDLLIQEYIGVHPGEDFRINILGNKFAVGVRRYNKDDFRSNVNQGGKMYKAFINHKMRKAAIKATKAVGADFAGVDVVLGRLGKPYVIEVNSNMRTVAVEEASRYRLALKMMKYMLKKARKERKIIKLRVKAKEFI
ncbi:MAG: ATP-grasp domain-containing protein, partial [Methanomicrobia archaeon]|nr:ATP-grasp domain-containing protein [Methanomicrobia archaeon]